MFAWELLDDGAACASRPLGHPTPAVVDPHAQQAALVAADRAGRPLVPSA